MSPEAGQVHRVLEARRDRMLARSREVAGTPDLRTADELIEAADILERQGDALDRGLAIEARRAALREPGFQRIAALSYLHRRSLRAMTLYCFALGAVAVVAVCILAIALLFHL